jgi:hypothetical protein
VRGLGRNEEIGNGRALEREKAACTLPVLCVGCYRNFTVLQHFFSETAATAV